MSQDKETFSQEQCIVCENYDHDTNMVQTPSGLMCIPCYGAAYPVSENVDEIGRADIIPSPKFRLIEEIRHDHVHGEHDRECLGSVRLGKVHLVHQWQENHIAAVLQRARDVLGENNQLLVSTEELCELASVLPKFARYKANPEQAKIDLYDKVLDEYVDVVIVLDHIQAIFGLSSTQINERILRKVDRLDRWLDSSDPQGATITDREV